MLCVLIFLCISGMTYSLKSTPNDRFLIIFSWQFCLLLEFLPEVCREEAAHEIFSYFRFDV